MTDQLSLEFQEPRRQKVAFVYGGKGGYRDQVTERAKSTGLENARRSDPEAHAGAIAASARPLRSTTPFRRTT